MSYDLRRRLAQAEAKLEGVTTASGDPDELVDAAMSKEGAGILARSLTGLYSAEKIARMVAEATLPRMVPRSSLPPPLSPEAREHLASALRQLTATRPG